jgi:hypothetical protein
MQPDPTVPTETPDPSAETPDAATPVVPTSAIKAINDAINIASYLKTVATVVFVQILPALSPSDASKYDAEFKIALAAIDIAIENARQAVQFAQGNKTDFAHVQTAILKAVQSVKAIITDVQSAIASYRSVKKSPLNPVGLDEFNSALSRLENQSAN